MKYDDKRTEMRSYFESNRFPGGKIPSEKELAVIFDTNLSMVREILREFEMLGIISKRKRQGNFINTSVLKTTSRLDDNSSFLSLITDAGYALGEQAMIRDEPVEPYTTEALELMGYKNSDQLVLYEEVYSADGEPAIFSYYYCPKSYFGNVDWDAVRFDTPALKQLLVDKFEPHFSHSIIRLTATIAEAYIAEQLAISPGMPLILWHETYYNQYDEVMGVSNNFFSPNYMNLAIVRRKRET